MEDGKHIQTIEQVAAKLACLDTPRQVPVGGRQEPKIDLQGLRAPQPFELVVLKHAQQPGLQGQRNFPDFIQEKRAPVGQLQAANLPPDRSREGSFLVTKQLAFQQT
jgi:hypothetical protein